MKDKVIETAGKAWRTLGENGESSAREIAKTIKEREDIVNQAIGWLAREDKINFVTKRNETLISLVQSELDAFRRTYQKQGEQGNSNSSRQKKKTA